MNILISGGTGFIGSYISEALANAGHRAWVLSRNTTQNGSITLEELPLISYEHGIETFIHSAVAYGRKSQKICDVLECNILYPIKVIESMTGIEMNCPKFVINIDSFFNKHGLCDYMLWYSLSKAWGKSALETYCQDSGISFINLMFEQVYGPRDSLQKFTAYVLNSLKNNVDYLDLSDGMQRRDFVYVTDVASAVLHVVSNIKDSVYEKAGTIEVGSGNAISLRMFVELAKQLSGSRTELRFGARKMAQGELMESFADIRFLSSIGWNPKVNLVDGIKNVFEIGCFKE